ncbi:carbon-nitrogen hydrolase [Lactarius akahatsu]|uniref:Carbon-nitrogen hydrolase n=1 Tax=Lactarius akahatsu TaxID=416441 RepID=A0AAD4LNW7_9AGAM|nr:carbon-nitrogen hydrolase [Lactarius akahatsu]
MPYSDRVAAHPSLRIAVVQFAPKIGQIQQNLEKARGYCESLAPGSIDLLCLPEMIFTGYAFENASAILPFLEDPQTGVTSEFCASIAQRLRCHVVAGYPERLGPHEVTKRTNEDDGEVVDVVGANSAVVYGPDGTGFATFHLPPPLNTVTLAICMDLNPRSSWTIDGGPYELADHCLKTGSNLLNDRDEDLSTMNYWATLLRPLWYRKGDEPNDEGAELKKAPEDVETVVVVCNRSGIENGAKFAGSSSLFRLHQSAGKPVEGVCVWRT